MSQAGIRARSELRALEAMTLRRKGHTFREIGELLGVSAGRAREIVLNGENIALQRPYTAWTDGLSSRVSKSLLRAGFENRWQVIYAIKAGTIGAPNMPEFGRKAMLEIYLWVINGLERRDA